MKQNKMYVTPKVDVIRIEPQGILCASGGGVVEPTDFTGTVMSFETNDGAWN